MGLVLFTPPGAPEIISERFKAVKLFLGLTKPVEVKDTNISEVCIVILYDSCVCLCKRAVCAIVW